MDTYFTVEKVYKQEIEVKDSKFISLLYPINSKEDFKSILNKLWEEHPRARHICYAYIIDEKTFHYYDDGEPSGSAGIRIYKALKIKNLTKVALFVIRYFGGTKLGTGPLAKAYFDASMNVLNSADIVKKYLTVEYYLNLDYNQFEKLKRFINHYSVYSPEIKYAEKIEIKVFIKASETVNFQNFLKELNIKF